MGSNTGLKAAIAFFVWLGIAMALSFWARDKITYLLGPDVWLGVALWAGAIVGLFHVLVLLMTSRQ